MLDGSSYLGLSCIDHTLFIFVLVLNVLSIII